MLSLAQIQAESRAAAAKAAREHRQPLMIEREDVTDISSFFGWCRQVPFLGDYAGTAGCQPANLQSYFPHYPYRWLFVDSSGMGRDDEPALSISKLYAMLTELTYDHGYRFAFAIAEAGEFQVHLAMYEMRQ